MLIAMLQQIKKDKVAAIKSKDSVRSNILSVIIGEAERSDVDIIKIIEKLIASNEEVLSHRTDGSGDILLQENSILHSYLPKKLTGRDLHKFISQLDINEAHFGKAIGAVVQAAKSAGYRIDGKEVSQFLSLNKE